MKYRSKLYLALAGTAFVSALLALGILYSEIEKEFLNQIRSKVLSIGATASSLLDIDALEKLRSQTDENKSAYLTIKDQLIKVRDANRRVDVYVQYIYVLFPSPNNPSQLFFGVGTEENGQKGVHRGDEAAEAQNLSQNLYHPFSPSRFIHDHLGTWLIGFVPIYDHAGKYIGTLGLDISAASVNAELEQLLRFGLFALLASLLLALIGAFILSKIVTISLASLHEGVREIGQGNLNVQVTLKTHDEFNEVAEAINDMTRGLVERERLKMNFARYVSQHVLEKILQSDMPLKLEGERKKITVLFSDIRQFTHLAEKLSPEVVVSILNEYFEKMLDVIFKNQGTLDKFIGDGIMVEFGTPLDDPMEEKHAVLTALEMQEGLKELSDKWEKEGKPRLQIGIGIHSGFAIVGNIGSEKRMEYTAVGDTVNVASRLEFATKILKTPILISDTTYQPIRDEFEFISLGSVSLPGLSKEMMIYTVKKAEEVNK